MEKQSRRAFQSIETRDRKVDSLDVDGKENRRGASCRYKNIESFPSLQAFRAFRLRSGHPHDDASGRALNDRRQRNKQKPSPLRPFPTNNKTKVHSPNNLDTVAGASAAATLLREHREELAPRGLLGELAARGTRERRAAIVVPLVVLVVVEDGSSCARVWF